ncbi:MAG: glycosyltransferase [Candidatus Korobacteraceae bacterium]
MTNFGLNNGDGLKVTLAHDWLTGMRGGEKVLELLCQRFPDAPLRTLLYLRGTVSDTIARREIRTSPLQWFPLVRSKYRHYLPLFPIMAELMRISDGDVVISSSHAVAKAMVRRNGERRPIHICYIHTPMRYVWDRFDDYFGPNKVGTVLSHSVFRPVAKMLQWYDLRTVDRVDKFIANSRFVADRVRRLYGRDAEILPPPVDVARFSRVARSPEDWYLMVTALAPYKRVDEAIAACATWGRKLKIVGSGPERKRLESLAKGLGGEVEFLGFVSDDDLANYYGRAKALLFPGIEDFGIVPVEAIAAGCPVIALKKGGVLDSMTDRTAVLYSDESVDGLVQAIREFELRSFDERELRRRAARFAPDKFLAGFEEILAEVLQTKEQHHLAYGTYS